MDIEKISSDLATQARGFRVVDQSSANRAAQLILLGKDAIKQIKDYFADMKAAAWNAHQKAMGLEKTELAKVQPIVDALSKAITTWRLEEEKKRKEAEDAAYRAEQIRIMQEAEAKRKADAALLAAEQAEAIGDKVAADAHIEAAAKIEEKIISTPPSPPIIVPSKPVTEGLSMRYNYSFEVTDKTALPEEYKIADQKALDAMARLKKEDFKIPGGHVVKVPSMAANPGRSMGGYSETH